jgi:hypothetical protein
MTDEHILCPMRAPSALCLFVAALAAGPGAVAAGLLFAGCRPQAAPLSAVVVSSADGSITARTPEEAGWRCAPNDLVREGFRHGGVKCVNDEASMVMNAKLYELEAPDARSAEIFCIQDWRQVYGTVFSTVVSKAAEVRPFRGFPACHVVLEGTTAKGPWRIEEIHAPNGRKLLQITVNGALPSIRERGALIDAWRAGLVYDLTVPGQVLEAGPASPHQSAGVRVDGDDRGDRVDRSEGGDGGDSGGP